MCVFSSHPFWISSSLDVPAGVTQEEGHTGFLIHLPSAVRALIFVARRIQPFLSLVDREVELCDKKMEERKVDIWTDRCTLNKAINISIPANKQPSKQFKEKFCHYHFLVT